jgi:ribosomal protein S18 acetylase RimI-like enzyme
MEKAEQVASERGCCKMTLEVLNNNEAAKSSYRASGYEPYQLDDQFGNAEFWQKPID